MSEHLVIAVDGPSGSGKSTVSKIVAERLGLAYLDTGAMYRVATWWAARQGIDLTDQAAVAQAVKAMPLEMPLDPRSQQIVCAGEDVTSTIRASELSEVVSLVATNLDVRAELIARQRAIIAEATQGILAEGRDITTVVAPDADLRLLITASQEARLRRRALQVRGGADAQAIEQTRNEVVRRDERDSTVAEFMTAPEGVTLIDTSDMTIDEVVDTVLNLVKEVR